MKRETGRPKWEPRRPHPWLPRKAKTGIRHLLRAFLSAKDTITGCSPAPLLLLAHIRSGSTLLHHVLISHPEILGCGERMTYFSSESDFERLRLDAHLRRGQFLRCHRYVTDQLNHNVFLDSDLLLSRPDVRVIFLIRKPDAAIVSMDKLLDQIGWSSIDSASRYYRERLSNLAALAVRIPARSMAFSLTYDDLTTATANTLARLTDFLGLRMPLRDQYRIFDFTGIRGDPSPAIRRGHIHRSDVPPSQTRLDAVSRAELHDIYENCLQILRRHCTY